MKKQGLSRFQDYAGRKLAVANFPSLVYCVVGEEEMKKDV